MARLIPIAFVPFALTAAVLVLPQPASACGGFLDGITRSEYETMVRENLAEWDGNGDGIVTVAEERARYDARREESRRRDFAHTDFDDEGSISVEEFVMRGRSRRAVVLASGEIREPSLPPTPVVERRIASFEAGDTNGDGTLSRAEYELLLWPPASRYVRPDGPPDWFVEHDADGNGELTLAEYSANALACFDAADADGDGRLMMEERAYYILRRNEAEARED